jgi:hypothetical protein
MDRRVARAAYIVGEGYSESMILRRYAAVERLLESRDEVGLVGANGSRYVLQ